MYHVLILGELIELKRHGLVHVETYDVTLDELNLLDKTCHDVGLDLQLGLFMLTMAATASVALLTTEIKSWKTFDAFCMAIFAGVVVGLGYMVKWFRNKNSFKEILDRIKLRQIGVVGTDENPQAPSQLSEQTGPPPTP